MKPKTGILSCYTAHSPKCWAYWPPTGTDKHGLSCGVDSTRVKWDTARIHTWAITQPAASPSESHGDLNGRVFFGTDSLVERFQWKQWGLWIIKSNLDIVSRKTGCFWAFPIGFSDGLSTIHIHFSSGSRNRRVNTVEGSEKFIFGITFKM